MSDEAIVAAVRQWVDSFVVALNLCPFARRELANDRVRFTVTDAATEEQLLMAIRVELDLLERDDTVETTLLIHPAVLTDFDDFNLFLPYANRLLVQMQLKGVYQIASFHPRYQFGSTAPDDAENYTNRSPYPMLHLIREASVERAVARYPDVDQIPARNIELMDRMGADKLAAILQSCFPGEGKADD